MERLDRLTYRGSANAKLLGQFALGRELIALFQRAFEDGFFDLPNDLFIEPRCLNYFVHELFSNARESFLSELSSELSFDIEIKINI